MPEEILNRSTIRNVFTSAKKLIIVSSCFLISGLIAGFISFGNTSFTARELSFLPEFNFTSIFLNNFTVLLILIFSGIAFIGITTLGMLFINGYIVGISVAGIADGSGLMLALLWIVPHGLFEFPGFLIAAAAGLRIPVNLVSYFVENQDYVVSKRDVFEISIFAAISTLLIFMGSIVEIYITPVIAT